MNEELYIDFERYLANEISSEEKIIFEQRLQTDASFKENLELYKETTQFLNTKFSAETVDFKENLKSVSNNYFKTISSAEKPRKSKVFSLKSYYYAVVATLLIAFGAWFITQQSPNYSDYNQHETAIFMERNDSDENLKNAQDYFNNKEYEKAVQSFAKLNISSSAELQYFYGISLIENSNFDKGELLLSNLSVGNSIYKDKATWNLALSKLKQKKYNDCKKYLKQIPADAEDYDKARELLKKLE